MDIKSEGYFPFTVTAKTKTSQAGKQYLSIGVGLHDKDQNGEYKTVWFNLIDKRDLLTLASCCENTYHKICKADNDERKAQAPAAPRAAQAPAPTVSDDEIPF